MKILKKIALFIFIGVVFATCKKETLTPSSTVGQPVFSFSGTIGGISKSWQAGVNSYYMYSSYNQNLAGNGLIVYGFTGTLQNTANSNNSISITINDDTAVSTAAASNISKSVTTASYYYNIPGGNPIWDSVTFTPKLYAGNPSIYTYNFGDGAPAYNKYDASPVKHLYKILKTYTTSLSATSPTGNPTVVNQLYLKKQITTPLTINSISSILKADSPSYHVDSLAASVSGGTYPYTYLWSFGDGKGGSSLSAHITHTYTLNKTYTVELLVIDYLRDTATHTYTLIDTTYSPTCRIDYYDTIITVPNPLSLSNVTVNYTDANGNQYTSNNYAQPVNSTFQVIPPFTERLTIIYPESLLCKPERSI